MRRPFMRRRPVLFVRNGELLAQRFDATSLAFDGEAFRLASGISVNPGISLASLAASPAGPIAMAPGHPAYAVCLVRPDGKASRVCRTC